MQLHAYLLQHQHLGSTLVMSQVQVRGEKISGAVAFHAWVSSTFHMQWSQSGPTVVLQSVVFICYCIVSILGFQLQLKEVEKFGLHHVDAYDITKSDL